MKTSGTENLTLWCATELILNIPYQDVSGWAERGYFSKSILVFSFMNLDSITCQDIAPARMLSANAAAKNL